MLTTTDVGTVTRGQGVPDHQVLPISAAQHGQAFCQLFQGSTAHAVCSGCLSYQGPAGGEPVDGERSRLCCAKPAPSRLCTCCWRMAVFVTSVQQLTALSSKIF